MAQSENIEIIKTPPSVSLINEGLFFKIRSLRNWSGGREAGVALAFPNTSASDYTDKYFVLEFMGRSLKFYFRENPNESALEITTWDDANDNLSVFVQKTIDELSSNYYIHKYYRLVEFDTNDGINIIANEEGPEFNIEMSDTSINGFSAISTSGLNNDKPDDYAIYFAAMLPAVDSEHEPTVIGEDIVPINNSLIAEDNIKEYLENQFETGVHFPFNGVNIYNWVKACIRYFLTYGEFYNNLIHKLFDSLGPYYVIEGGLKQIDKDFLDDEGVSFFDYMDNDKMFLTWSPNPKITFVDLNERLYFLVRETGLKVKLTTTYKHNIIEVTDIGDITADEYQIIEIACGAKELFNQDQLENLISYKIFIVNQNDEIVSEIREFVIDKYNNGEKRSLIFKNSSFGTYEFLHCTGLIKINDNIISTDYINYHNNQFRKKSFYKKNKVEIYLNTGWISKKHRLWIEDLLLSKEIYFVLGDFLLPVSLINKTYLRHKEKENLFSVDIGFTPNVDNSNYSSIVGEGATFLTDEDYIIYTDDDGTKLIE